ncbi:MAG: N-acetylmuramoyl-L-alanine amidase [Williamsia sp.]|nr:N-acetylmuramoyl-L-alanine amidase [Williamsia sp.]
MKKHPVSIYAKPVLKTIIVDPGHGGTDQGAHGLFSTEADVALGVGLKLGKAIQKEFPDIKIVFTRTTDVLPGNLTNANLANRLRAQMANEYKGMNSLYISIHCNATQKPGGWYAKRLVGTKPKIVYVGKGKRRRKHVIQEPIYESYYVENKVTGTETYIWAADRSDEKSKFVPGEEETGENVQDTLNVLDLDSPEARIRATLYTKTFFNSSYLFAKYVEDEFLQAGRTYRGGVKQRNEKGIWVLQATGMPSVLIETGFITNKQEEEYLNSEDGQLQIVENVIEAVKKYKKELESSSKPATLGAAVPSPTNNNE